MQLPKIKLWLGCPWCDKPAVACENVLQYRGINRYGNPEEGEYTHVDKARLGKIIGETKRCVQCNEPVGCETVDDSPTNDSNYYFYMT